MASIFNGFSYRSYNGSLPGAGDQNKRKWDITPSIPFSLDNGKTIVVRGTLPISFGTPAYLTEGNDFAEWQIHRCPGFLHPCCHRQGSGLLSIAWVIFLHWPQYKHCITGPMI